MQCGEGPPRLERLQDIREKSKRSTHRALVLEDWHISHGLEDQL